MTPAQADIVIELRKSVAAAQDLLDVTRRLLRLLERTCD